MCMTDSFDCAGLMWTAASLYNVAHALTLTVALRHVCVFTAPLFAAGTCIVAYLFGTEVCNRRTGLAAAVLISIVPGERSI
jgi:dolichyl-diphosphooligosaccharide--protein glycosyltransferase